MFRLCVILETVLMEMVYGNDSLIYMTYLFTLAGPSGRAV